MQTIGAYLLSASLELCGPHAKSVHSCSDRFVFVSGLESQPVTVGVGLRQRCMLSPLLFIYMNWIDTNIYGTLF